MSLLGFAALPALLTLAGAVLALTISPWWWILAAVGAALLIVAIIDYAQPKNSILGTSRSWGTAASCSKS